MGEPIHQNSESEPAGRRLVYFGHMPGEGTGSPIIVYRHLCRLANEGWQIHVVAEWGQDDAICRKHGWSVRTLSHRKPWWPPYHPDRSLSRAVRTHLWAGEIRQWIGGRPDAVLTYLSAFSDTLSIAAVGFAKRFRVPLTTIHHDDTRCFAKDPAEGERAHRRHQWILENSSKSLFASPALAACFQLPVEGVRVLAPIPEGWSEAAAWNAGRGQGVRIYYAGALWPAQFPLLARLGRALDSIGGRLVVLSRGTPELRALIEKEPLEWMDLFPSNREALEHLTENASALLVSYADTVADMPWIATSFPSKFVEYSHLGLPCAIVAPRESAIARWAEKAAFPDVFHPDQLDAFTCWAASLKQPEAWSASASSVLTHARGEFHPGTIQRHLEESLLG